MSWFSFSSKKPKPVASPQSLTSEISSLEVKEDDDFIMVNNQHARNSAQFSSDPSPMYPLIPPGYMAGSSSQVQSSHAAQSIPTLAPPLSQLQGVPFRLSKDASMLASTEQTHQFVVQRAQAAISSADRNAFVYDFAVEKSVLKETY